MNLAPCEYTRGLSPQRRRKLSDHTTSLGPSHGGFTGLLQKSFDDGLQSFGRRALKPDDSLLIENENRRPRGYLPFFVNGSVDVFIPPAAPDQVFHSDHVLQLLVIVVTVNAQQSKRLISMQLNVRPLVRGQFPN